MWGYINNPVAFKKPKQKKSKAIEEGCRNKAKPLGVYGKIMK
jgi:hypothetical protein